MRVQPDDGLKVDLVHAAPRVVAGQKPPSTEPCLAASYRREAHLSDRTAGPETGSFPVTEPRRHDLDWVEDELILACDLVAQNDWKQLPATDQRVLELSQFLQTLPLHPVEQRMDHFRNPNSVARKTADIATNRPGYAGVATRGGELTRQMIMKFLEEPELMRQVAARVREGASSGDFNGLHSPVEDEDEEASEGRLLIRRHVARERSRSLRSKKIARVLSAGGRLACEACGFEFERTYGDRGRGYIECHHIVPLYERAIHVTRLNDLALVCANCHRMIHTRAPWVTPTELGRLIGAAQARRHQSVDEDAG